MATYEEVINGSINSLRELKELIRSFKDELTTAKEGSDEWKSAAEGLAVTQERVDKIQRAAKGTLEGYNKSSKDSINTLKQKIKELNAERNAMDMNSKEYAKATEELNVLNKKLRESGVAAGDMRANVGNYAESLAAGFNGVKDAVSQASSQMVTAIGGLGTSLGGLSPTLNTVTTGMNGLTAATGAAGIALAAIAAALAVFKEGVQSSEENTNKFKQALAPVESVMVLIHRAIIDVTGKFLDWIIALRENEKLMNALHTAATVVVAAFNLIKARVQDAISVFSKWYDGLSEIASKIGSILKPVTDTIGNVYNTVKNRLQPVIDWIIDKWNILAKTDVGKLLGLNAISGAAEAWREAEEAVDSFTSKAEDAEEKQNDIIQDEIALQKMRRSMMKENAKIEGEIAAKELEINEERNKEDRDYDKILGLINEKVALQKQVLENNIEQKRLELSIIKQRNALSKNSTADFDAEARAEAELTQAQNALTQAEAAGEKQAMRITRAKYSEQRTNAVKELNGALKEFEAAYNNTLAAMATPIAPQDAEIDSSSIDAYHDAMQAKYKAEYEAYAEMTRRKIEVLEAFIAAQKEAGYETAEQEAEIIKLRAAQSKEYKKMTDSMTADDRARTKEQRKNYQAQLGVYSNLMSSMQGLFEENTIAYKMTATAKAIIDTYSAANSVLAEQTGGLATRIVAMASTIAAGIANVMSIWRTDTKNPSVSTTTNATTTPAVEVSPISYSQTVQTAAAEETINQTGEDIRVYVLESDITDAQNMRKVRVAETSF